MTKQKKIMVLGAGPFQLAGIRKATEIGYYVITVDYLPDNIGHKYSNSYVNCSTINQDGVLKAAKKIGINGIVTFSSDAAIPTVAYVSSKLGLCGLSIDVARTMTDKPAFRKFQKHIKLPHPNFLYGYSLKEIYEYLDGLTFPIIFKPADSSGSRGVSLVYSKDWAHCQHAFENALVFSRSKRVCIEDCIQGTEVGGDGFLLSGKFHAITITHKYLNGFVVTGHSLPTNISAGDQNRIISDIEKCCSLMGYINGPLNFDVMVTPHEIVILEISPRTGGNCIPDLIRYGTGIDMIEMTLRYSMRETLPPKPEQQLLKGCGSYVFGSEIDGILRSMATEEEIREKIDGLFEYYCNAKPNTLVNQFNHGGNMLGYVLFKLLNKNDYERIVAGIKETLRFDVISKK